MTERTYKLKPYKGFKIEHTVYKYSDVWRFDFYWIVDENTWLGPFNKLNEARAFVDDIVEFVKNEEPLPFCSVLESYFEYYCNS